MELNYYKSKIFKRSRTKVKGVGTNDMDLSTKIIVDGVVKKCPIYDIWVQMLNRTTEKYQDRFVHYKGTTVCEEWKLRSNFHNWTISQDWVGKAIDKDIIDPSNTEYRPDKCKMVPQYINNLLTDRKNHKRIHPLGVTFDRDKGLYVAQCNVNGVKSKNVGVSHCPFEAHSFYQLAKADEISRVANSAYNIGDVDLGVFEALMMRVDVLRKAAANGDQTKSIHHFTA